MSQIAEFLTNQPWFAALIGILLLMLGRWRHSVISLVTASIWLGYSLYEYAIWLRWLCQADCNIRIDLLFIYPVLFMLTGISILHLFKTKTKL